MNIYECISCDAMFKVKHEMEDIHYVIQCCPFCGEELDIETELKFSDDEEYDE
jgi:hypothetical protein|tara:strand:- start:3405 stop:3563 length:159 start_codon:yes stop_codon:yes gene_type:complete